MTTAHSANVSGLLQAWSQGDAQAREDLVPLVYQELRKRAAACLRRERPGHTLQPTALVNETYLRLMGQPRAAWRNRAQFFAVAAQIMRRVLVDHARERRAAKREGGVRVSLDEGMRTADPIACEVLMLDEALQALAQLDPRQAHIVELKYFGGLSEEEVAALLSLSRATITREWQSARAWLFRRLTRPPQDTPVRLPRRGPRPGCDAR
jgi:RNA polymerase sigma factor (TIGR02999 family)